jgi:ankyrin repeat protein
LDAQASAHLTNDGGLTASHIALQRGDKTLAYAIYDIAICNSIVQHNLEDMIALIGVGGDPNVRCSHNHNFTPMILATKAADLPAINILLEYGADVNMAEDDNWTPLMFAAVRDNPAVVERLLRAGAVVDAVNNRGQSALSLARLNGIEAVIEILNSASKRSLRSSKDNSSKNKNTESRSFHTAASKESHSTSGQLMDKKKHPLPKSSNLRATSRRNAIARAASSSSSFQSHFDELHYEEFRAGRKNQHTPSLATTVKDSARQIDHDNDYGMHNEHFEYEDNKQYLEEGEGEEEGDEDQGLSVATRVFRWLFSL